MICTFEIDIDRPLSPGAVTRNPWSPVRGRWDASESRLFNDALLLGRVSPAFDGDTISFEKVWRNLDLQFSEEEASEVGSGPS